MFLTAGSGAADRAGVEPAQRLRRPERVLLALPLLDRPAGREVAADPRRAHRSSRRARSASWPTRWRRWCACRRCRASPGARPRRAPRTARARPIRWSSRTRRSPSPSTRATASSPALHWHLHLLGQLLGEFYLAKLREEELRQASYLQAVHETGARMTHDIKNLLQSLNVLVAAAARDEGRDSPELRALMRRQLPAMSQRLAETLDKLQRPREAGAGETYVGGAGLVGSARAPVPRRASRVRRSAARRRRAPAAHRCSTASPTT